MHRLLSQQPAVGAAVVVLEVGLHRSLSDSGKDRYLEAVADHD